MERITTKHLDALTARLNRITGSPTTYATRTTDGALRCNVGNFHISHAYGGVSLHRTCNPFGGVTTPIGGGHVSKRELYERIHAFIAGLEFSRHESVRIARGESA